jgi:hypothetical protein
MATNLQIKKIKTLQRVCGLNDDAYRDILRNRAGVSSSKELRSKRQVDAVMTHLGELAEKINKKANRKADNWKWENTPEGKQLIEKADRIAKRFDRPSSKQMRYIFGLWWSLRHEWQKDDRQMEKTLNHFLENGRGGPDLKIANWQWMTPDMAQNLIAVLKGRLAQGNK